MATVDANCSPGERTFADSFEMGMDGPVPKSAPSLTTFDFSSVPTLSTISGGSSHHIVSVLPDHVHTIGDLPSPARRSLQMLNVFGNEHDLPYKQSLFGGNKEPDMFKVSMDVGDSLDQVIAELQSIFNFGWVRNQLNPVVQCLTPSLEMSSSYLPSLSALSGISNTQFTPPLVPAGASRGLDADDSMPQPLSPALSPVSKLHRDEGEALLSYEQLLCYPPIVNVNVCMCRCE